MINQENLKLHLGCGHKILPDYINVDKYGNPDVVFDLETFPWPWENDSVVEIVMHHVLEHLGQDTNTYLKIIQEIYRICKNQAVIDIQVPHHRHDNFIIDPTHVRPITVEGLTMFSKKANLQWQAAGVATTTLGLYLDVDFEVTSATYVPDGEWASRWNEKSITLDELSQAARNFNNVFGEVHIKMVVVK
ncbi:class I SAM-dependent methyltransferase [Synechococcus sp. BDU 130192]|uniref:class I SAM-dependent methyltransferase n=1 Tax=Synechococcus sp. BDU 130192 TaxID=2042059 RepID=UPI0020B16558|nr:hypothetical protein [Synechococcus sp. BDU 130192]